MVSLKQFKSQDEYIKWLEQYAKEQGFRMMRVDDVGYYSNFFIGDKTPAVGMASNVPWGNIILYSIYVNDLEDRDLYRLANGLLSAFMVRDLLEGVRIIPYSEYDIPLFEATSLSYMVLFAKYRYPDMAELTREFYGIMMKNLKRLSLVRRDSMSKYYSIAKRIDEQVNTVMKDGLVPFSDILSDIIPIIEKVSVGFYRVRYLTLKEIVNGKDLHITVIEPITESKEEYRGAYL